MKCIPLLLFFIATTASAQDFRGAKERSTLQDVRLLDSTVPKKWFVSSYTSLSAGFIGFKGGSASYIAAPIGIQLNRALNNKWTAFGGVSMTPVLLTHHSMQAASSAKGFPNSFMSANLNRFTVNPAAYLGANYTSGNHSFQVEARIVFDRGNYLTDPAAFGGHFHSHRTQYNTPLYHQSPSRF